MRRATIAAFVGVATLAFAGGDALTPELVQVVSRLQPITAALSPAPEVKSAGPSSLVVSSRKEADSRLGRTVAVVGEARRGKTPNLQVTPDFYVICIGGFRFRDISGRESLDWPEDVVGRQVRVIGKLEKRYLGEANGLPTIESNFGYFLREGTGERIERQRSAMEDE